MTTLAANAPRDEQLGDLEEYPVIATDIIYEGAAVGENGSGYARPLVALDPFLGFAERNADNSAGAAGAINALLRKRGTVKLPVTGAAITDLGLPVYAQDDNAFSFIKTAGSFVGRMARYVSSGIAMVEFGPEMVDPFEGLLAETLSDNKTLDALDTGKVFFVDTDAKVVTLPAVAKMSATIVNAGADAAVLVTIASNASDNIQATDLTAVDDKDLLNTKTTARRGDYASLEYGDATGWNVNKLVGTWAKE
jgi:hypothetical protein